MKKSVKTALSFLFILIFVLQFACVGAFADDGKPEEIGSGSSGWSYAVDKLQNGFKVLAAEGKYVANLRLNETSIMGYARYNKDGSVEVDKDYIEEIFEIEALKGKTSVTVNFAQLDPAETAEVTVETRASSGTQQYKDETPIELKKDNSGVNVGRNHESWKVQYKNGGYAILDAEDTVSFTPFGDCSVSAMYSFKYIISYKIAENQKQYDGTTTISQDTAIAKVEYDEEELDISDFSVSGISYSIADAAVESVKEITVDASGAVVKKDDEELDADKYILKQYGGDSYNITKRDVTVKAEKVDTSYNGKVKAGKLSVVEGLLKGDELASYKYKNQTCAPVSVKYTAADFEEIVIKNSKKEDVTANYNIVCDPTEADYIITAKDEDKPELTFAAKNISFPYTGNAIDGQYQITEGDEDALEGIDVVAVYKYDGDEHTNVGKRNYKLVDITLKMGDYNVTKAFKVSVSESAAELNITAHKATITINDNSKEYDGTPLYAVNCKIDGLLEGHRLDTASLVYTNPVEIGSGKSDIQADSIKILDAADHDVTDLYDISVVRGNLTVSKLKFTVIAGSNSKKFDGTALEADNSYSLSETDAKKLQTAGWHLAVETKGSQKAIGSSDVTFKKIDVLKADGSVVDVKYYEYSTQPGKLTVEPDPSKSTITITVESSKKVYDGTALILDPKAYTVAYDDDFTKNYSIEVKLGTASITNAGKKTVGEDVVTYTIKDKDSKVVENPESEFNIQIVPGTLEVTKYPIKITAKSGSKTYDGKEFVINSCTITAAGDKLAKSSHDPKVTIEAQDGNGNKVQAIKVGKYYNVITKVTIKDKDTNMDVTANYDITTVNGTLTIKNSNGNPQTGDNSNISLWATVLAVSAVAVVCVAAIAVVKGKRKAK